MTARPNPVAVRAIWQRFRHDDCGATIVLMALTITVLLATTGLAVDTGWWYTLQRQNQSAADAAAIAAAYERINGNTDVTNGLTPAAVKGAELNGYTGSAPVVTNPYGGEDDKIEVVLSQVQATWFASLAGLSSITLPTRAVAKVENLSQACVRVLNKTEQALSVIGSAQFRSPNCAVCSASTASNSIYVQGGQGAVLEADTLVTAGEYSTTGSTTPILNHPAQLGSNQCGDPYASVLTHSFLTTGMPVTPCLSVVSPFGGNCVHTHTGGNQRTLDLDTVVLTPNTVFQGGLIIKNQTVDLLPGTYWIADGDLALDANSVLRCSTCAVGGNGVTIILTTTQAGGVVGNITQAANALVESLNAPGSGDFQNLLLVQDSNELPAGTTFTDPGNCTESCSTFQGGAGHSLEGLFYVPKTDLTFQGTPTSANGCLLIVADTLKIIGNGQTTTLATGGCPVGGPGGVAGGITDPLKTISLVE